MKKIGIIESALLDEIQNKTADCGPKAYSVTYANRGTKVHQTLNGPLFEETDEGKTRYLHICRGEHKTGDAITGNDLIYCYPRVSIEVKYDYLEIVRCERYIGIFNTRYQSPFAPVRELTDEPTSPSIHDVIKVPLADPLLLEKVGKAVSEVFKQEVVI